MSKKIWNRRSITAILFICFLGIFSYKNLLVVYEPLIERFKTLDADNRLDKELIKEVETILNEHTYQRYNWIENYGYIQELLGKDEVANFEVIRDKKGFLHYSYFATKPNQVEHLVKRVSKLEETLKDKKAQVMYIMPPDKYIKGYTKFNKGLPYNYANETADAFLKGLKREGIETLDLRENLFKSGIPLDKLFFKTDHHWTIETAFWAFTEVVQKLNLTYGLNLDKTGFYTDANNYNFLTYEESYIGSMARKTGMYYSGVDDFTVIYPKFSTRYIVQSMGNTGNEELKGSFEEAVFLIPAFMQEGNIYETDKYFAYLRGNLPFVNIINLDKPNGPKALFIKDSMSVPMISFLSTLFSEIYVVDPRYYAEDIVGLAKRLPLDFVFLSMYPPNLTSEFFPFYEEISEETKGENTR